MLLSSHKKYCTVKKERVLLGMSGGMDSSMSAVLLQQQGYEVVGTTLQTHTEADHESIIAAQNLARERQIEHHLIDCRQAFKDEVISYFANEYINGRTPNPCIHCNETIKWKYLLQVAKRLNCQHISTGHYVRKQQINKLYYIQKGVDPAKDQSYFLWNLSQEVLKKALFPLGDLKKEDVRTLARKLGYTTIADKKESMGVCFLSGIDYRDYLRQILPADHPALQPGQVVDTNDNVLGQHEGFPFYTIGQRRGIEGVAKGMCVVAIDASSRRLIADKRDALLLNEISIENFKLTSNKSLWSDKKVFIRIRGLDSVPGYWGHIKVDDGVLKVVFDTEIWAITPGQSIVFYNDDCIIGGGIIE